MFPPPGYGMVSEEMFETFFPGVVDVQVAKLGLRASVGTMVRQGDDATLPILECRAG